MSSTNPNSYLQYSLSRQLLNERTPHKSPMILSSSAPSSIRSSAKRNQYSSFDRERPQQQHASNTRTSQHNSMTARASSFARDGNSSGRGGASAAGRSDKRTSTPTTMARSNSSSSTGRLNSSPRVSKSSPESAINLYARNLLDSNFSDAATPTRQHTSSSTKSSSHSTTAAKSRNNSTAATPITHRPISASQKSALSRNRDKSSPVINQTTERPSSSRNSQKNSPSVSRRGSHSGASERFTDSSLNGRYTASGHATTATQKGRKASPLSSSYSRSASSKKRDASYLPLSSNSRTSRTPSSLTDQTDYSPSSNSRKQPSTSSHSASGTVSRYRSSVETTSLTRNVYYDSLDSSSHSSIGESSESSQRTSPSASSSPPATHPDSVALSTQLSGLQEVVQSNSRSLSTLEHDMQQKLDHVNTLLQSMSVMMDRLEKKTDSEQPSPQTELPDQAELIQGIAQQVISKMDSQLEPLLNHHLSKLHSKTDKKIGEMQKQLAKRADDRLDSVGKRMDHIEELLHNTLDEQTIHLEAEKLQEVKTQLKADLMTILDELNEQHHLSLKIVNQKLSNFSEEQKNYRELEESLSEVVTERMQESEHRIRNSLHSLMSTKHYRKQLLQEFAQEVKTASESSRDGNSTLLMKKKIEMLMERLSKLESAFHDNKHEGNSERDSLIVRADKTEFMVDQLSIQFGEIKERMNATLSAMKDTIHKVLPKLVDERMEKLGSQIRHAIAQEQSVSPPQPKDGLSAEQIRAIIREQLVESQSEDEERIQYLVQGEMKQLRAQQEEYLRLQLSDRFDTSMNSSTDTVVRSSQSQKQDESDEEHAVESPKSTSEERIHVSGGDDSFELAAQSAVSPIVERRSNDDEEIYEAESSDKESVHLSQESTQEEPSSPKVLDEQESAHLQNVSTEEPLEEKLELSTSTLSLSGSQAANSPGVSRVTEDQQEASSFVIEDGDTLNNSSLLSTATFGSGTWSWCLHIPLVVVLSLILMVVYDLFFPLSIQFENSRQFYPS